MRDLKKILNERLEEQQRLDQERNEKQNERCEKKMFEKLVLKKASNANSCSQDLVISEFCGRARGVMVIVVGHGHGDTSLNPGAG